MHSFDTNTHIAIYYNKEGESFGYSTETSLASDNLLFYELKFNCKECGIVACFNQRTFTAVKENDKVCLYF